MRIVYRPAKRTWFFSRGKPFAFEVNEDAGEVLKLFIDGSRELAGHTVKGIKHIAKRAGWRTE